MRTLRDTATLAVLILLALTFRLETPDASPLGVVTPAHASMAPAPAAKPAPVRPDVDVDVEAFVPGFARPAELRQLAASLPRIAAVPLPPGGQKKLVWELDSKRVVVVLGGGLDDPDACEAHRARTSS